MPCSLVEIYQHSPKTLQYFCQTTPCHILKDGNLLLYRLISLFQECTLLTQWYMQDSHQWSLSLEHLPYWEPLLSMGNVMFCKHLLPTRQWGYNPESVEDSPILYLVAVNINIIYNCTWYMLLTAWVILTQGTLTHVWIFMFSKSPDICWYIVDKKCSWIPCNLPDTNW